MLPIKHLPVNWVDGMKISKDHFMALEDMLNDRLRDAIGLPLTTYNYGILPPIQGTDQSLDIYFSYDAGTKEITVKVNRCRAVTPGGVRIEIFEADYPALKKMPNQPQVSFKMDSFHTLAYDIVLSVDPFARVPYGQPDPEDVPLRQPYVLPRYNLEIIPFPRINRSEFGAYQLTIGRIEIEAGEPKLSQQYIPPCYSLNSYRYLASLNDKILKSLDELELKTTQIIQKKKKEAGQNELSADTVYLAERIAFLLAGSKDYYKLIIPQQPPLLALEYCLRLARTLYTSLESCQNKFDLLDYYCNWLDWNPGRFEKSLNKFLAFDYNHENLFDSFKDAEDSVNMLLAFFNQVYSLIGHKNGQKNEQKSKPKIYGWLVEHTKGKKMRVHTVHNKESIIGRGNNIDVDVSDDTLVSREHVKLMVEGDEIFCLNDLGSKHGTLILQNGKDWKQLNNKFFYIKDGDIIQIGKTHLVFKTTNSVDTEEDAANAVKRLPFASSFEYYY